MPRDRLLRINLPKVSCAADALAVLSAILQGVSEGLITPAEGANVSSMAKGYLELTLVREMEERLKARESQRP